MPLSTDINKKCNIQNVSQLENLPKGFPKGSAVLPQAKQEPLAGPILVQEKGMQCPVPSSDLPGTPEGHQ